MTETAQDRVTPETEPIAGELMEKLARYPGSAFRKAYLANLLASGNRLSAAGDSRTAAYCFGKVADALKDAAGTESGSDENPESDSVIDASHPDTEHHDASRSGRPPIKRAAETPLEMLSHQWRKDRLLNAESVLRRQGKRLSPLENQIYREKLDKLKALGAAGEKAGNKSQSAKTDSSLLDLRRQLYRRVLKSQKVSMRRRALPATALRQAFLLPGTMPAGSEPAGMVPGTNPASSMELPESPAQARPAGFQAIVGPYNDRYNLGDLLTLLAQADATWVEEFLDLYRGLLDLKVLVTSLPGQVRK